MSSTQFRTWLINMPRWAKHLLLLGNDAAMLAFALWAAYSLRLNVLYVPPDQQAWLVFAAAPLIGVATFYMRGLYRLVTRYIGDRKSVV